jgi:hypothetical protein
MAYSLDTSGILDAWVRYYPPDVFPTVWQQMDSAATTGVILAIDEVVRELERKEDGAHKWFKARPTAIVPIDSEIEGALQRIMGRFPKLVDTRRNKSGCDPFVIALAQVRDLTVVTAETRTGSLERPKIPDVCDNLGLKWVNVVTFFREQHWRI